MTTARTMAVDAGLNKLRAASCSVLLLLLTLALVASSLLVARYAVAASSWWLSLLAITVCLLGLCTWIQLAASRASRAGRWRIMLARQMALSRAQRTVSGGALAPDLYAGHAGRGARCGSELNGGLAHVAVIPLESELDAQMPYRVPGPPPPPPYALSDLPPSYCAASEPPHEPLGGNGPAPTAPAPPPGTELPPPYAVAIKRDHLVQGAAVAEQTTSPTPPTPTAPPAPAPPAAPAAPSNASDRSGRRAAPQGQGRNRVVMWY